MYATSNTDGNHQKCSVALFMQPTTINTQNHQTNTFLSECVFSFMTSSLYLSTVSWAQCSADNINPRLGDPAPSLDVLSARQTAGDLIMCAELVEISHKE